MLHIQHLTKHYPGTDRGVTDLSLHVAPGDLYAFIGHNGAGKTTTLKAVVGIHAPDEGEIFIDGLSLGTEPLACKRKLAYIPDDPTLFPYLTGIRYLQFVADVYGLTAEEREVRIAQYAAKFGMEAALGDLISAYSHGMKQKLALMGALIHEPRLLILDEPFVGLDPAATATVKACMRALCAAGGAVFFSTHVLDVAERLCNKVAILRDGRLVTAGAMEDVVHAGQTLEDIFLEVYGHA